MSPLYKKIVDELDEEYPDAALGPRQPRHQYTKCTPGWVSHTDHISDLRCSAQAHADYITFASVPAYSEKFLG